MDTLKLILRNQPFENHFLVEIQGTITTFSLKLHPHSFMLVKIDFSHVEASHMAYDH